MSEPLLKDGIPYHIEQSSTMKPYWDGLNQQKLMTTRCDKCSAIHFPPSPQLCTNCFNTSIGWMELPLSGTMNSWTRVSAPPEGFFGEYVLASVIVDLLNKPILGRFTGSKPEIGKKISIGFEKVKDQYLLIFK